MTWLIDTNVISETIRPRPAATVLAWLAGQSPDAVALSAVTMAELHHGAAMAEAPERRALIAAWIDEEVAPSFADRTLPVTIEILTDWLGLGRRLRLAGLAHDAADMLIAATARIHGLAIVSRNVRDFSGTGITVLDPWTGDTHRMDLA